MSAPAPNPAGRPSRTRARLAGLVAALVVLVVALGLLAALPRSATADASLTVTPRTEAGADAAVLLADRYTALAGSTATLQAAREASPALGDVSLDELQAGTEVVRTGRAATITVRVTLPDRDAAAAAANAVVDALVAAGTGEGLVDVDRGAEATPSRAGTSPDPLRWALASLLLALTAGAAVAVLTGRRRTGASPTAPPPEGDDDVLPPGPAEVLDDLPEFLENPPGSTPAALPAAPAAPSSVTGPVPATTPSGPRSGSTRHAAPATGTRPGAALATAAAVLVLVLLAGVVALVLDRSDGDGGAGGAATGTAGAEGVAGPTGPAGGAAATLSAPTESAAPGLDATVPTTSAPAEATETAAGTLALTSVPLGADGVAASVSFQGVVLEQRAVGLTVTYPSVSISTDGRRALAHVRLPTFNCLTAEPPADPAAAGCARSLTEYADLADPQLQVTRDGDRLELVGLFPTYTRPNGTAPVYTGRAYQLTAAVTPDGTTEDGTGDGAAPAAGVVRIGLDSAPTTTDGGVNRLQYPG